MKKILTLAMMLGLCGAAALYLSSCAKLSGPLSPDIGLLSASSQSSDRMMCTVSSATMPASLSGTAHVFFSESGGGGDRIALKAETLNTSTVQLYTQDAAGTSQTLYNNYGVRYNPINSELQIYPVNGLWTDNTRYHLVLTTGIQTMTGNQLDGNANQIPESPEFDNYQNITFPFVSTGTLPTYFTPYNYVVQASATIQANGGFSASLVPDGYVGGVTAAYSNVTITVGIWYSGVVGDPNVDMDTSTFYVSNTQLHSNVEIVDANGVAIPAANIDSITIPTAAPHNSLTVVLKNLPAKTVYKVRLKGGLTGIRSSAGAALYIGKGFYFDGDGDGVAEASDDTKWASFGTAEVDNTANAQLTVAGPLTYDATNRRIPVTFNITAFYGQGMLDAATVNNSNFILIDESASPARIFAPSALELDNSNPSAPIVYVYVPLQFFTAPYPAITYESTRTVRLIVREFVKTKEGLALDTSGDGIAGQPNDAYTGTYSVLNATGVTP